MNVKQSLKMQNLAGIERILQDHLVPIRPRAGFVDELRHKLAQVKPEPPVLPRGWRTVLVSTAGVFSGLLIVGAAVRTVAGLIGMVSLIRQIRPAKPKGAASITPA